MSIMPLELIFNIFFLWSLKLLHVSSNLAISINIYSKIGYWFENILVSHVEQNE
jgi:hypothetical protein